MIGATVFDLLVHAFWELLPRLIRNSIRKVRLFYRSMGRDQIPPAMRQG